jgi:hypothetical protein
VDWHLNLLAVQEYSLIDCTGPPCQIMIIVTIFFDEEGFDNFYGHLTACKLSANYNRCNRKHLFIIKYDPLVGEGLIGSVARTLPMISLERFPAKRQYKTPLSSMLHKQQPLHSALAGTAWDRPLVMNNYSSRSNSVPGQYKVVLPGRTMRKNVFMQSYPSYYYCQN